MKINNLKINAFGNIAEKEINFNNKINIIYGENESGKSTLLKFIVSMFYGISKNKRGKEISDYEKYKPWDKEEFSGKLNYELDNKNKYEIFRDFNKKNVKILNEYAEDISFQFPIDKNSGNQFFYTQTQIEENTFLNSLASMQKEVELDKEQQNAMIQKITNITGTGEESVSFKKTIEKLNKKQLEEIGTERSMGRPINIIEERKNQLEIQKKEIEKIKNKLEELQQQEKIQYSNIEKNNNKLELIKKIKIMKDKEIIENEKLEYNKKMQEENNKKEIEIKKKKEIIEKQKLEIENKQKNKISNNNKRNQKIYFSIIILFIILNIINSFMDIGFMINGLTYSPIKGGNGNIEYLAYFKKDGKKEVNVSKVVSDAFRI